MLSSLQHVNVVGYHTAWMEHVQPAAPESLLPALEAAGNLDRYQLAVNDCSKTCLN